MNHSTPVPLDQPIGSALMSRQAHLRQGDRLACRYFPDVAPFAAISQAPAEATAAWQALRALLPSGEQVAMLSLAALSPGDGLQAEPLGALYQMVARAPVPESEAVHDPRIVALTDSDAPEMFELAQQTKPGPFGKRTHQMGHYIGIRDNGRLIAMAGERMQLDGFVEISAVCVDPGYRGQGLAGRLINVLRQQIGQRGDTPFLHVLSANESAIALYERLGFERRQAFTLSRISHASAPSA
jgi:predicted GNAT family acetyltransferase